MYLYGKDELTDKSACAVARAELKMCLLMSKCVQQLKKTPRQCLLEPEGMVPDECFVLRTAFFECKRSLRGCCDCYCPDPIVKEEMAQKKTSYCLCSKAKKLFSVKKEDRLVVIHNSKILKM